MSLTSEQLAIIAVKEALCELITDYGIAAANPHTNHATTSVLHRQCLDAVWALTITTEPEQRQEHS